MIQARLASSAALARSKQQNAPLARVYRTCRRNFRNSSVIPAMSTDGSNVGPANLSSGQGQGYPVGGPQGGPPLPSHSNSGLSRRSRSGLATVGGMGSGPGGMPVSAGAAAAGPGVAPGPTGPMQGTSIAAVGQYGGMGPGNVHTSPHMGVGSVPGSESHTPRGTSPQLTQQLTSPGQQPHPQLQPQQLQGMPIQGPGMSPGGTGHGLSMPAIGDLRLGRESLPKVPEGSEAGGPPSPGLQSAGAQGPDLRS